MVFRLLLDYRSLYGEYSLLATMDEPILEIDLGIGKSSQIGLSIALRRIDPPVLR